MILYILYIYIYTLYNILYYIYLHPRQVPSPEDGIRGPFRLSFGRWQEWKQRTSNFLRLTVVEM